MKTYTSFEYTIRRTVLHVECYGISDEHGLFHTAVTSAWLEGVNVFSLLTDDDVLELYTAAEHALLEQIAEDHDADRSAFNPQTDAFQLGE